MRYQNLIILLFLLTFQLNCTKQSSKSIRKSSDTNEKGGEATGFTKEEECIVGKIFDPTDGLCKLPEGEGDEEEIGKETISCEQGQIIENHSCKNTEEYCNSQEEMTLGADGRCQATAAYCSAINLSFDADSKICVQVATNEGNYSIGGTISYYNQAEQNLVKLSVNSTKDLDIPTGNTTFHFSNVLKDQETYKVTADEESKCSIENAEGTITGLDVSNVKVHCSDSLKSVKLNVANFSRDIDFILNGTETKTYKGSDSEVEPFVTFSPVASESPISIKIDNLQAIECTFSQVTESDTEYEYNAECIDTGDLKVLVEITGLEGTGLVLLLNGSTALLPTANGILGFDTSLKIGESYAVTVQTQPTHSATVNCKVTEGSGTITNTNIVVSVGCHQESVNYNFALSSRTDRSEHNKSSASTIPLGTTSNRFCLLSRVVMEDLDSGNEEGICSIDISNGITSLRAELKDTGDADTWCSSYCLTWDQDTFTPSTSYKRVTRDNTAGTSSGRISTNKNATTFCGLSEVGFREADSVGEVVACEVNKNDSGWNINAFLGNKGSDKDSRCSGRCLIAPGNSGISKTTAQSISQNNSEGVKSVTLAAQAKHFCYLTKVSFEDIDAGGEPARCEVRLQNGFWILEAALGNTPDADANCSAQCIKW